MRTERDATSLVDMVDRDLLRIGTSPPSPQRGMAPLPSPAWADPGGATHDYLSLRFRAAGSARSRTLTPLKHRTRSVAAIESEHGWKIRR